MTLKFTKLSLVVLKACTLGVLLGITSGISFAQTLATIGTGAVTTTSTGQTPYGTLYEDGRNQWIITAAELNAAGITGSSVLSSLAFNVVSANATPMNGFTVKMGHTTQTSLSGFIVPQNYTTCFTGVHTASFSWNTHTFQNNFVWDGSSNLVVEVCFDNGTWASNSSVAADNLTPGIGFFDFEDFTSGCLMNGSTFNALATNQRPQMRIAHMPNNACQAPPIAGNLSANPAAPCFGTSFSVGLSGGTAGSGQTYAWESSTDNINWSPMAGSTASLGGLTMTGTIYYRVIVTCSGQSDTASFMVSPAPFFNCYCSSTATSTSFGYIGSVQLGSMFNVSPSICQAYTNYTALPQVLLIQGTSQTLNVDVTGLGCTTGNYGHRTKVYIDWNQNGSFTDPGEELLLSGPTSSYGMFTGTFVVPANSIPGTTGMRIVTRETTDPNQVFPCGGYTWGETEDYLVFVSPPPTDDAGITAVISPASNACTLSDTLIVSIGNLGTDTLNTADVSYQINNGAITTVSFSGSIAPGATGPFQAGTAQFNDGDTLKIWTSNPNGVTDLLAFNDTLTTIIYTALNGAYTVYGNAPDFNNMNDALTALNVRGACGNVTFNVRAGTYTEQMTLIPFPGAGPNARVTIQSEDLSTDSVRFNYNVFATASNYSVWFNGGDYYTLNELTLASLNPAFSNIIRMGNGSDFNVVQNCVLIGDTMASSDLFDRIVVRSTDGIDNNNHFLNNLIRGGSRGVSFAGQSIGVRESSNRFENNTLNSFWTLGLGLFNQNNVVVNGNHTSTNRPSTNNTNIQIRDVYNGGQAKNNFASDDRPGSGMVIYNVNGTPSSPFLIANNSIYMMDSTSVLASSAGISLTGGSNIDLVHNSVVIHASAPLSAPIRIEELPASNLIALNLNVWNNILAHYGTAGPALRVTSPGNLNSEIHNNLWSRGNVTVVWGSTNYNDLPSYQAATGLGANSIEVDPLFTSSNLATCLIDFDNVGTPYPGLNNDYAGNVRSTTMPDMGAFEFTGSAGLYLGDNFTKCQSTAVTLNGNGPFIQGSQYFWSNFSNDSTITITAPGTYSVTIFTGCAQVADTIVISNYPNPTASFTSSISFMTASFNAVGTGQGNLTYSWDFGDLNTGTGPNPIHVYSANGTYTVTLNVTDECGSTGSTTQTVNITALNIEDESSIVANVWPNPSAEVVSIVLNRGWVGEGFVQIMDMAGRIVKSFPLHSYEAGTPVQLNISDLVTGVYTLRVNATEVTWNHKLIKH